MAFFTCAASPNHVGGSAHCFPAATSGCSPCVGCGSRFHSSRRRIRTWPGAVTPMRALLPRTSVRRIVTPWSGRMISSPGFLVRTNMIEPPSMCSGCDSESKCIGTYRNVQEHYGTYRNVRVHFGTYRKSASTLLARNLGDIHVSQPGIGPGFASPIGATDETRTDKESECSHP